MKRIIKKLLIVVACIPLVLIGLLILAFLVSPIMNERTLNGFAKQIYNVSLPPNTKLIEKEAVCGKLNGNGNGMDFFACMLIQSDIPLEKLEEYYQDKYFRRAKNGMEHPVTAEIIQSDGYQLKTSYLEHSDVYFNHLEGVIDYIGYYVVMIYDGGYESGFDIRGN